MIPPYEQDNYLSSFKSFIMKKKLAGSGILLTLIGGLFAFSTFEQASITGKVSPGDGAQAIWAISATDSVKSTNISSGSFSLQAKPGTYKLIIDAKEPYKDVTLDNLELKQDQVLDVGEIVLQQ
jgi:hypothetical protein